jgi:hypothetical protein
VEAIPVDDIPAEQRDGLGVSAGGNICTVLRRRDTGEYPIGLEYETTLLFHSLVRPDTAAAVLKQMPGERRYRTIARLVSDEILQIELSDGSFADGVRAHEALFGDRLSPQLDRLSRSAIDQAVASPSDSSVELARRLYSFNATPRSNRWDTLLTRAGPVARWLGLEPRAAWRERLSQRYEEYGSTSGATPWLQWTRREPGPHDGVRHKIYVSPASDQLAEALPLVAEVCRLMDVPAFKVGATLFGVLRPDKLVVYVQDQAALWRVAAELRSALAGVRPHGVPFTAAIDAEGLLSWAMDPADEPMLRPMNQAWTWRTAIAERLAVSIAHAKGRADASAIVDFALERLRLDGIEPIGWLPGEVWCRP